MGGVGSQRIRERTALAAVAALAAALLLPNLDEQLLWQDEAQTAVVARTIVSHGIPLGHDGRNHFSQELGKEYGDGYVWKWHTWLSFYAVAASFFVLGEGTGSARLPFALFGVATVVLAGAAGRVFWRDGRAAVAGALLLALSVPFLILGRQCRYYAMASFFSLLGLIAYARLGRARHAAWLLFGAASLLFHTHYVYSATLLASVLIHAGLFERARLGPTLRVTAGVILINLPWIVWLSGIRPGGESHLGSVLDLGRALRFTGEYARLLLAHVLPASLLLALPLLAGLRRVCGEPLIDRSPETWRPVALVLVFCAVNVVGLSLLSPLLFYRYLAPLAPPLLVGAGFALAALSRRNAALAAAVLVVFVATGDLRGHLHEITHDFAGPIEGIVTVLRERGSDADTVAISYGDMPLKFYTGMRVVGGLTGEDLAPARDAEWIIPRRHVNTAEDRRVRRELLAIIGRGGYELLRLDFPDTAFENREDPRVHRFRPAGPNFPRVRIFRRHP